MKTKFHFLIAGILSAVVIILMDSFGVNAQPTWTQKASLPIPSAMPRFSAVGFSIGTKGYIGVGYAYSTVLQDFWEWDQATDTWTQKADFGGGPRYHATGFSIGNKGYIGIGVSPYMEKDFWEWDQPTNIWTKKADFPGTLRYDPVGFSIGKYGYVGTGAGPYKSFWEWDQAANAWTRKSDFGGIARTSAAGFSIGSKGYIGVGWDGNSIFKDFWEWDQQGDFWTQRADFPGEARYGTMNFVIGKKGFIGSGDNYGGKGLNDYYSWDQTTNTWKQEKDFPGQGRGGGVGFSIGNKGYVGTGSPNDSKSNPMNDFWEYSDTTMTPPCSITITAFSDPTSICAGNMVGIFASGGTAYMWNTGATVSHIMDTPSVTTSYTVTGTDAVGCTGVTSITISVYDCATGIGEIISASNVSIFPNPFSESALVIVTGLEGNQQNEMKIYDMLGNEVRSIHFTGKQTTIERRGLSDGVYFYKVISLNGNSFSGNLLLVPGK